MKKIIWLLVSVLVLSLLLAACNSGEGGGNNNPSVESPVESTEDTTEESKNPGDISGEAMDNFLAKLEAGNYVMDCPDFINASVLPEEVIFDYAEGIGADFAVMSVNNESFQGFLVGEELAEIMFVGEGRAIDVASIMLPTSLLSDDVSGGNIYNVFYNDMEDPLKFVSYEDSVKRKVGSLAGYGAMMLGRVQDVYLILDDVDPSVVHIQAVVEDDEAGGIYYDDIDITITFGTAQGNPVVENWMNAPEYPEAEAGWSAMEEFVLNSIFLPGYGVKAVPYPDFKSYAFTMDQENYYITGEASIRDSHASEEDMNAYISKLEAEGFTAVQETDEDGTAKTWYRRVLREEHRVYSSIYLEYDNGITMIAKKFYDYPVYEGIEEINKVIVEHGYLPLPETENISGWIGTDIAYDSIEGWNYFYDYNLFLYVNFEYNNYDELMEYTNNYIASLLENGFHPVYSYDEETPDYYEAENGYFDFRYHEEMDGTVTFLFKSEKYISAEETGRMIQDAGFPAIEFSDYLQTHDRKMFRKVQYGDDYKFFLSVSKVYDDRQTAETFLSDYEAKLNEEGFLRVDPQVAELGDSITIYNEDTGMVLGLNIFDNEDGTAIVNYDFAVK